MPHPVQPSPAQLRAAVVKEAHSLVGIREVPTGSNRGTGVHMIQSATHAYGLPWCVSTGQYIWLKTIGTTWAEDTAGVYFLLDYARAHKATIAKPIPGCGVCYLIGAGHYGTVVKVYPDGTFDAVEGNHSDACAVVRRDPRHIECVFVLRPELRDK